MSGATPHPGTITVLLRQADGAARIALIERTYPEMRQIARRYLARRARLFRDSSTVLVHRVCQEMLARENIRAQDRRHFFRLFGRIMHDILIDEVRTRAAIKRGGNLQRRTMEDPGEFEAVELNELIDLRDAIEALREEDETAAEIVTLIHLCGLSIQEAEETLQISTSTVRRNLDYGVAWLRARLSH